MKEVFENSWLGLLSLFVAFLAFAGCKEQMDDVISLSPTDDLVTVSLNFGFADSNGDDLYLTGSPHRLASPARLTGSPHRLASPARLTGSPHRLALKAA